MKNPHRKDYENSVDGPADPTRLSRRIALLAREFFVPDDLEGTLSGATSAAAEVIATADSIGVTLTSGHKQFRTVAATSPLVSRLDTFQLEFGQGPSLDTTIADPIIHVRDMRTETRWTAYAPVAVEAGALSSLSVRLYTHHDDVGTLNLVSCSPDAFSAEDEVLVELLAAHAATAAAAARLHEQLTNALASRDVIGQAKGIIIERLGVDGACAFSMLRRLSQDNNIPLAEIAARVVADGAHRDP
jgi:GAF domain-containing protein